MPALYIMIPAALVLVAVAIYVFFWAVDSGQYDDMDGPAHSILFDDQDPDHQAAAQCNTPEPKVQNRDEAPDA
ncbi:cbb3-type cytochrome oxidase assembly protein CcoS [Pseudomonas alliivorans]|uniref:cbb3-type cytochrome oxidase assembly protein CcoS n=1 Tax=Pseudomonas TaxID=286 RepID=UPI002EC6B0DA|nr:cbb3-type cytochrome oxidase assembly protein CcoS [Pseudomonas alliivorans]MEE4374856.1 cbb3-type cytochrome oxidase assembly protein CcoS [Pseudomonas alliivorans]MEE4572091.1 cbb3-type cytochrome oxidase assembly protein CcoS [Pseudomonas alliivorans]MEE4621532.1 cbb3-type cytochrome oxidase assembly protein CcoS [Pseudomonas alliivorans]MEE4625381.1 cbb3-type cytochrome oxidase assembly protein CcoS [Pseudomonas alliivorans]